MINSVKFQNFRGLKQLELPGLSQITLLTGRNNAGKSSILEGIFLIMDHTAVESFGKINNFRGLLPNAHPASLWEPAFFDLNTDNQISISMNLSDEECFLTYERDDSFIPVDGAGSVQSAFSQFTASMRSTHTLKFQYQQADYKENGYFSINDNGYLRTVNTNLPNNQIRFLPATRYINPSIREDATLINWIGQLELKGEKQKIIEVLKIIEPEITDILAISNQGQLQLYARIMGKLLPVRLAGDGLNRLLYILMGILENPNSVLLIDEIDAGFHYSMLDDLWRAIAVAAKESGSQIIATTHSYECIQNAIRGIIETEMEKSFCLYRVERNNGYNKAFRYDGELARFAVEANMEVR